MAKLDCMPLLGCWAGYRLDGWRREVRGGVTWLVLSLLPDSRRRRRCSGCGKWVVAIHDQTLRRVRDLPVFDEPVELEVQRQRLACPRCGPKLEHLDWLERHARVTQRLAQSVARMCATASIHATAKWHGLDWKTVKALDFRHLVRTLAPVDLSDVRVIAMDEFTIQKGHRYATVVVEPSRKRVLWVGRGRSRADIRPFFELLGKDGCERIQAVAMDMNSAFDLEVKALCPNAEVVYDLFHVVAKYGREVIDRGRVDEANRLRQDKPARRVVKTSRWLLLRNRQNVPADQRVKLKELLAANKALLTTYVLKDDLKQLWRYRSQAWARLWHEGPPRHSPTDRPACALAGTNGLDLRALCVEAAARRKASSQ